MQANGEAVPEPIAIKNFSGKFLVRITPELHRRLVIEVSEAGVRLIVYAFVDPPCNLKSNFYSIYCPRYCDE